MTAAPIGNIGDLSPRACEALANAYMVLSEDTRRASRLLAEAGISHGQLVSFYDHNEQDRIGQAMAALQEGHDLALISDAGTPLLSDPGYRLVRACREQGMAVRPIPGPCAPVAALSAAGIAPLPFTFLGFLPRGRNDRLHVFKAYGSVPVTLVFFERKDRLMESLAIAREALGDRELAICRELTKPYEEFILGRLAQTEELARELRGELTIIIGPAEGKARMPEAEALALVRELAAGGCGMKAAARAAAGQAPGWSARELYGLLHGKKGHENN